MNHFKTLTIAGAVALLFSIPARADVIGFGIGASYWAPELSGEFSSTGAGDIDLSDDLDVDDPSSSSLVLTLEHPVPFLPNVKYQRVDLDSSGRSTLSTSITFEGQTYSANEQVSTDFDLTHDDIVLYYEVLDNWVNLDIGIDLKTFDGEISLVGSTTSSAVDVDETLPLLYIAARFDLPFSGFYVGAELSTLSFDDNSAADATVVLGYKSSIGLGIEGGIRTFGLEFDDVDDVDADIEYDGAFVNAFFRF